MDLVEQLRLCEWEFVRMYDLDGHHLCRGYMKPLEAAGVEQEWKDREYEVNGPGGKLKFKASIVFKIDQNGVDVWLRKKIKKNDEAK